MKHNWGDKGRFGGRGGQICKIRVTSFMDGPFLAREEGAIIVMSRSQSSFFGSMTLAFSLTALTDI